MVISLTEDEYKALRDGMLNTPYESNGIRTLFTGLSNNTRSVISVNAETGLCKFYFGDYDMDLPRGW